MAVKQVIGPLSGKDMLQDMLLGEAQLAWVHLQACVRRTGGIGMPVHLPGTSPVEAYIALRAHERAWKEQHRCW